MQLQVSKVAAYSQDVSVFAGVPAEDGWKQEEPKQPLGRRANTAAVATETGFT